MALTGDFGPLRLLTQRMAGIASPEFKATLSKLCGAAALKQLSDGFRANRNPYGQPWDKLKKRQGQILRDTGRLANSFSYSAGATGFRFGTDVNYAVYHQYGTDNLPQREMVPDNSTGGVGPIWGAAFNREADAYMRKVVGK